MNIAPVVVPAREQRVFALLRVASISIVQPAPGGPVNVSYQLEFYRINESGAEAAPAGTGVGGSVQYGVLSIQSDPRLAAAVTGITAVAIEEAVKAGLQTLAAPAA